MSTHPKRTAGLFQIIYPQGRYQAGVIFTGHHPSEYVIFSSVHSGTFKKLLLPRDVFGWGGYTGNERQRNLASL